MAFGRLRGQPGHDHRTLAATWGGPPAKAAPKWGSGTRWPGDQKPLGVGDDTGTGATGTGRRPTCLYVEQTMTPPGRAGLIHRANIVPAPVNLGLGPAQPNNNLGAGPLSHHLEVANGGGPSPRFREGGRRQGLGREGPSACRGTGTPWGKARPQTPRGEKPTGDPRPPWGGQGV